MKDHALKTPAQIRRVIRTTLLRKGYSSENARKLSKKLTTEILKKETPVEPQAH